MFRRASSSRHSILIIGNWSSPCSSSSGGEKCFVKKPVVACAGDALDNITGSRCASQDDSPSGHPFFAYHRHFEAGTLFRRRNQRNHATQREMGFAHRVARVINNLPFLEKYRFQMVMEACELFAWKGRCKFINKHNAGQGFCEAGTAKDGSRLCKGLHG